MMRLVAVAAFILVLGIFALFNLARLRRAIAADRGAGQPVRAPRLVMVSFLSTGAALGVLLLGAFASIVLASVAQLSVNAARGLGVGLIVSTLWTTPVVASALVRWTLAAPGNAGLDSVRLPPAYWICEYAAVIAVAAALGMLAEAWRSGTLIFFVLPVAVVFPPSFRALVGPLVLRGKMRRWLGQAQSRPSPVDTSPLQIWVDGIAPRYGLRAPPAVIAIPGARSIAAYAVPAEAAIILGHDHLSSLTDEEQRALAAHELAHIVRRESRRRVAVEALVTLWYVGLFSWWLERNPASPFGLRLLWMIAFGYVLQAVRSKVMRRGEFAADRLAAEMLGDRAPLIRALKKLAAALRRPDRRSRTHPAFADRIAALEAAP